MAVRTYHAQGRIESLQRNLLPHDLPKWVVTLLQLPSQATLDGPPRVFSCILAIIGEIHTADINKGPP